MTKNKQRSRIKIIFMCAALFLVALSILSFLRIQNLVQSGYWINHTNQVKLHLDKVSTSVSEADANQKNYFLTGNTTVLSKRDSAFNTLALEMDVLDSLVRDNPIQTENLKTLRASVNLKLVNMQTVFHLYKPFVQAPAFISGITESMHLTEGLKGQISNMQNEEDKLLRIRSMAFNQSALLTPLLTISLILGAILILIAAYFKILQELKISDTLKKGAAQEQVIRKAIEETQQRFHQLIYSSPSAIGILYGEDLVITVANQPILDIWGKGKEIIGKPYFDALPELAEQGYKEVFAEVYKTGIPFNAIETPVYIVQNKITTLKYYNFILYPQRNINNEVDGIGIIATEVTSQALLNNQIKDNEQRYRELSEFLEEKVDERTRELLQINEALKFSEERYHRMVGEVQDYAIILLSKDGLIENWNKGAEKIKGYKEEEIIGKSFSSFYTAEARANHVPEMLLALAKEKGKATDENWRVRKDGSKFWGSVVITALRDNNNNILGFVKVTRDLTERKLAEEEIKVKALQLEKKNTELEKTNKELESFTYISSHDLQEPLRQIQSFAFRIKKEDIDKLSVHGKEYLEKINDAAARMRTLIQDLLTYSRTAAAERTYETTDLRTLLDGVKEDMKEEIKEKQATIEAAELCHIDIIRFQFRQLMHNLIGNALKFSKPGLAPHIQIKSKIERGADLHNEKLSPQRNYCHISIADNGIGFEPQYKERIFEVFQRLHDKYTIKGTGIGLAIAKKIVENHNGFITATGEPDKGATFDIYIPVNS